MRRLLCLAAILLLLLSACDDDAGSDAGEPTRVRTASEHADSFNDVVLASAAEAASAGLTGSYTLRAHMNGDQIEGTIAWSQEGERLRSDFSGEVNGEPGEIIVISGPGYPADDLLYACSAVEARCLEERRVGDDYTDELLPSIIALRMLDVRILAAGLTFYDETSRAIVGQPARCFIGRNEMADNAAIDHGEVCLTDGGAPLLVTGAGEGRTISLAALSAPGEVSAGVFETPYVVQGR